MTTTTSATKVQDIPPLRHKEAMALSAVEYERTLELVRSLGPDDWAMPVADCAAWNIRQLMCHQIGAAESGAAMREGIRQQRAAGRASKERGIPWLDAWTALQVEAREALDPAAVVKAAEAAFARGLRGRTKTPGIVRRIPMKFPEPIGRRMPMGYLIDTIGIRDMWMHRVDMSRATGRDLVVTTDHDGRIVADVVKEWAALHGRPFSLALSGTAGGVFEQGLGGEAMEMDAVEFCRVLSGRGRGEGLLRQAVPF